jgi:hypothetical protein
MEEKKKFDKYTYDNEYVRKNFDRINICVPKGLKPKFKELCNRNSTSMNSVLGEYIIKLLYDEDMLDDDTAK